MKIILKPVVIISIIFSITIVLAGIGIAAMTGAVETLPAETLPATPAQQMNVESEETFLVDSYIQKESEDTSIPMQNYIALQEKAARAEHITPQIETDKFEDPPAIRLQLGGLSPLSPSDCNGKIPHLYKHLNEKELKLERRLVQNPSTGECRYVWSYPPMTQEELDAASSQRLSMAESYAENFPVVVPNDEYTSHPFILEVREKKKNNVEQKDLENTVAIIITGQLQDKGYTTFTLEGVFQRSSMNMVIDGYDPLYLTQGNLVNVIPLDYGFKNNNRYTLTAINGDYSTSITWTPLP